MTNIGTRTNHGYTGSAADKGSSPPRLTLEQLNGMDFGTHLVITWEGGNGPHLYKLVKDDTKAFELNNELPIGVKHYDIVTYAGYVSLPGAV